MVINNSTLSEQFHLLPSPKAPDWVVLSFYVKRAGAQ